jgi:hypothetical protein
MRRSMPGLRHPGLLIATWEWSRASHNPESNEINDLAPPPVSRVHVMDFTIEPGNQPEMAIFPMNAKRFIGTVDILHHFGVI